MNKITISMIFLFLIGIVQVKADTWGNEETKMYYSSNKNFMLKVIPRIVPKNYWKWVSAKPTKRFRYSGSDTIIVPCHGILYKISTNDTTKIWERKFINIVSPVSAIVSDDGAFVVTFDNWYTNGYGVDVMVVYNEFGDLKKRYQLEELSPFPINDYQLSISSLWWSCGRKFIDNQRIKICFIDEKKRTQERIFNVKELKFE